MEGSKSFKAIAILADMDSPISPCGICRQFIREFAPTVPIYMFPKTGDNPVCRTLDELLPMSFGPEHLG